MRCGVTPWGSGVGVGVHQRRVGSRGAAEAALDAATPNRTPPAAEAARPVPAHSRWKPALRRPRRWGCEWRVWVSARTRRLRGAGGRAVRSVGEQSLADGCLALARAVGGGEQETAWDLAADAVFRGGGTCSGPSPLALCCTPRIINGSRSVLRVPQAQPFSHVIVSNFRVQAVRLRAAAFHTTAVRHLLEAIAQGAHCCELSLTGKLDPAAAELIGNAIDGFVLRIACSLGLHVRGVAVV